MSDPLAPEATEGAVKYRVEFTPAPALDWTLIGELDAWRTLLFRLGLNGQDPARYGGLAYGNVSRRLQGACFLISGTQTGGLERLSAEHYCRVTDFATEHNMIVADGPIRPSSEALTHAAAYQALADIQCVLHVHSPELWRCAQRLELPITRPSIAYGTPEMAVEVATLLRRQTAPVIAMGGHQDGLIAVGATLETAALPLIRLLAEAVRLEQERNRA